MVWVGELGRITYVFTYIHAHTLTHTHTHTHILHCVCVCVCVCMYVCIHTLGDAATRIQGKEATAHFAGNTLYHSLTLMVLHWAHQRPLIELTVVFVKLLGVQTSLFAAHGLPPRKVCVGALGCVPEPLRARGDVLVVPKQHVQRPASMLGLPLQLADEREYSLAEILKSQRFG